MLFWGLSKKCLKHARDTLGTLFGHSGAHRPKGPGDLRRGAPWHTPSFFFRDTLWDTPGTLGPKGRRKAPLAGLHGIASFLSFKVARLQSEFCTKYFFRATNVLTKNALKFSPNFLSLCSVGQKKSRKIPSKFPTQFSKFPCEKSKKIHRRASAGAQEECLVTLSDQQPHGQRSSGMHFEHPNPVLFSLCLSGKAWETPQKNNCFIPTEPQYPWKRRGRCSKKQSERAKG